MADINDKLGGCLGILIAWFAVTAIIALPIMALWNWLCPLLWESPRMSFWMAFGISLLLSSIFGGVKRKNK